MKYIIATFLSFLCLQAAAGSKTFEKLAEVNKCWSEQKDINQETLPAYTSQTEHGWIQTHLMLVEQTLRARNTTHLTSAQKQHRLQCLDYLNQYWHDGNFPINDRYSYRTPIFIDQYNNFCAVGYLIKATGNEHVSRMVAAKSNLAYVRQMNYKEVFAWAFENGFTEDELAWIQPSYPPVRHTAPIGKGIDGIVHELYADDANGKLYVGGSFITADSTITANNIAYVTESNGNYTWHNMGSGVNGAVYAISSFNNNVFVAGSFTQAGGNNANNVAYWDGTAWHSAGCLSGRVNDLVVFENELYAAGQFDVCSGLIDVNFARWDGTSWVPYSGLIGSVNTMEVVDNTLFLGGNFNYGIVGKNIIKWDKTNGFQSFVNDLANEVNDIEAFGDTVYAVCTRTSVTDSSLVNKLDINNMWVAQSPYLTMTQFPPSMAASFKTLCAHQDTFMVAGDFFLMPMMGNYAQNCFSLFNPGGSANWFNVDSAINKMVVFKGELIAGGKFKYGNAGFGWGNVKLNGITRKSYSTVTAIKDVNKETLMTIYPNPANPGSDITIKSDLNADKASILNIQGRNIASFSLGEAKTSIALPQLSSGAYLLQLSNKNGEKATKRFIIK